jgi:radical SAM protein
MHGPPDFAQRPFIAIWETTRACDLACVHCRAVAQRTPLPGELTHREGLSLIDAVAELKTHVLVLSGGDPLKRADLFDLIRYGKQRGLRMATIPAATDALTAAVVSDLKHAGLDQMALSLDAPRAEDHDDFRGVPGAYAKTLQAVQWAHQVGLPLQINTVINTHNVAALDAMIALVRDLEVVFWEVFFLVPMGRGQDKQCLTAEQFEIVFERLYPLAQSADFIVKVTEAPHYKRFYLQQRMRELGLDPHGNGLDMLPAEWLRRCGPQGSIGLAPAAVNAGKGHCFIAYDGMVYPSGFLPVAAGNVREHALQALYQKAPLFLQLRDPDALKGACRRCMYRQLCGGSRARAYAMTGDYLAEEPCCAYAKTLVS